MGEDISFVRIGILEDEKIYAAFNAVYRVNYGGLFFIIKVHTLYY